MSQFLQKGDYTMFKEVVIQAVIMNYEMYTGGSFKEVFTA